MQQFFTPASVAVVGASPDRTGQYMLANAQMAPGVQVYPVNPKYDTLGGLPCYASIRDIPGPVDLALLLVPARLTPQVLEDCIAKKVPAVMIQSAGFAEIGEQGRELQDHCVAMARAAGIRLWGPNCMGLVDAPGKRFFTFMHPVVTEALLPHGTLSLVVQSGMLSAGFLADLGTRRGVAINKVCSMGNKCDVDECDVLEMLLADQSTRSVGLYLESLPRGRHFLELAESADKPLVVLKSGRSQAGAHAALSHTASLAGDARLTQGLLAAAGVCPAQDFNQMVDLGRTLGMMPELPSGARVAVITFSGGAGILSCDLMEDQGLALAQLSEETLAKLQEVFPPWMPPSNPVDLWPSMELHGPAVTMERVITAVAQDPGVDLLLLHFFVGGNSGYLDLAALEKAARQEGKRMAIWCLGMEEAIKEFEKQALTCDLPVYSELGRAVESLGAAARWRSRASRPPRPAPSGRSLPEGLAPARGVWDEHQSKRLLSAWGLPTVAESLAASLEQAQEIAEGLGWPAVLKGLLPGEVHKTEMGLVALGVSDPTQLVAQWERLQGIMQGRGAVLVQRQHCPDYELIAGYLRDPQFGPTVMLGLGGVLAELEPDVAFELAPLDETRALAMLERLRGAKLLNGFRGMPPLDRRALAMLICRLGDLGASLPGISQIDLNPVAVENGSPLALDASIIWEEPL